MKQPRTTLRNAPTVDDVARMKSSHAKREGGSTPPPPHVRRIEAAAASLAPKKGH